MAYNKTDKKQTEKKNEINGNIYYCMNVDYYLLTFWFNIENIFVVVVLFIFDLQAEITTEKCRQQY